MLTVSVVIPAYNAAPWIADTLESVLTQKLPPHEVLVVDNGSTDDTPAIVQRYAPRGVRLLHESEKGVAHARTRGVEAATGNLVAFVDADDVVQPDKLAHEAKVLGDYPDAALILTDYCNFTEQSVSPPHFSTCPSLLDAFGDRPVIKLDRACPLMAREAFGIASTITARHAVVREIGYRPLVPSGSEDFLFYYSVARRYPIVVSRTMTMLRRLVPNSLSQQSDRYYNGQRLAYQGLLNNETDPDAALGLRQRLAEICRDLSRMAADRGEYRLAWAHGRDALRHHPNTASVRNLARVAAMACKLHTA